MYIVISLLLRWWLELERQMASCQNWGVACLYSLKGLGKGWDVRKAWRLLINQDSAISN